MKKGYLARVQAKLGRFAWAGMAAFLLAAGLGGCASDRMANIPEPQIVNLPQPDQATVVFLRPSAFGGAIQSSVFDISDGNSNLIGIVSSGKKIAYGAQPGKRRFMVIGESADFIDAELLAGRLYFVRIAPRFGFWKARFSLDPAEADETDLASDLKSCQWVGNTAASQDWAYRNMASIRSKQAQYLAEWLAKPDSERPKLLPEQGARSAR